MGGATGAVCPGPQCKGAPNQCRTCSNKICSSVTFQSSFFKGLVSVYFRLKSACSYAADANNAQLSYMASAQSAALYVALFDLKLLIENSHLQVYMYRVHARKGASGAPRTHLRACKISKFRGACPQTPLTQSILWDPTFCICPGPSQCSRQPCIHTVT